MGYGKSFIKKVNFEMVRISTMLIPTVLILPRTVLFFSLYIVGPLTVSSILQGRNYHYLHFTTRKLRHVGDK